MVKAGIGKKVIVKFKLNKEKKKASSALDMMYLYSTSKLSSTASTLVNVLYS